MARIFVSHSSLDNAEATRIKQWLGELGFDNAFLDIDQQRGIAPGQKWETRLYEELAACSALVLLVTPNWLASKWCFAEFVQARSSGKAIFPIILTPDGGRMFASDLQRVDFVADRETGERQLAQRLKEIAIGTQQGFDWDPRRAPYPGLPSFEADDAAVYFGRDPEVRDLIERLHAHSRQPSAARMVAVLGASGSGKSSLVRAGVLPHLAKFDPAFAVLPPMRPGADPLTELAKVFAQALGRPLDWSALRQRLVGDPGALAALATDVLMASGRREATLLLTLDQAEELFTLAPAQARAGFDAMLARATQARMLVLLTLRSDFLGELQQWAPAIGAFEQFSLAPMPAERLAQVIEGPARVAGASVAPGLTSAMMRDAGGSDAMPLLAFTLRELWMRAQQDAHADGPTLRLSDYAALADPAQQLNPLENAVRRRADELVATIAPDGHALRALRDTFVGLLTRIGDSGTYGRRAAAWNDIAPAARDTIAAFVQARLLVARTGDDQRREVEVAHESLLRKWPLLVKWLVEERSFLLGQLQLQHALTDWQAAGAGQRESALLQGLMLERARAWLAEKPQALGAEQRAFIAASLAQAQAKQAASRRRRLAVGLGSLVALAAIGGLGVYLYLERQASSALAVEVESDRWVQRSAAALSYGQPDRALAQAARAHALLPDAKTRSAVWQAGVALAPQLVLSFPAVADDGSLTAAPGLGAVAALAWTPASDALLLGDHAGALHRLGLDGKPALLAIPAERRQAPSKDQPEAVRALQTLADGSRMAVLEDGRILRQAAGGSRFDLIGEIEAVAAAAVASDGSGVLVLTQALRQARWVVCPLGKPCTTRDALPGVGPLSAIALDSASAHIAGAVESSGDIVTAQLSNAAAVQTWRPAMPAGTRVGALSFDPSTQRLALATNAGKVVVLSPSGEEVARLVTLGGAAQRIAWSRDGKLAADCEEQSLCVWRTDAEKSARNSPGGAANGPVDGSTDGSMSLLAALAVRGGGSGAIAWSNDGQRLASGDLSGRLNVWDLAAAAGRAAVLHSGGAWPLAAIDVAPDQKRVAAADVQGRVFVWDLTSQRVQQRSAAGVSEEARALSFHPRQPQLALATLGGGVSVHALDTGELMHHIEGMIESLAWDAADGQLLTAGQDGQVRRHRLSPDYSLALPEPHQDAVVALALVPAAPGTPGGSSASGASPRSGATTVVYSADTRGVVKAHGGGESGTVVTMADTAGKTFSIDSLSFAPDGRRWLAAGSSGEVWVFDRGSRKLLWRLESGADQVNSAAFSPDGRFIAALDNVGRVHVWAGPQLERYASLWLRNEPGRVSTDTFGQVGQLRRMVWLPDSSRLAIATQSGTAIIVAVPTEAWLPARR